MDFHATVGWVDFYAPTDGITWTQFGVSVTYTPLTVFNGTAPFAMGGVGNVRNVAVTSRDGATSYINEDFTDGRPTGWTYLNNAALIAK